MTLAVTMVTEKQKSCRFIFFSVFFLYSPIINKMLIQKLTQSQTNS